MVATRQYWAVRNRGWSPKPSGEGADGWKARRALFGILPLPLVKFQTRDRISCHLVHYNELSHSPNSISKPYRLLGVIIQGRVIY